MKFITHRSFSFKKCQNIQYNNCGAPGEGSKTVRELEFSSTLREQGKGGWFALNVSEAIGIRVLEELALGTQWMAACRCFCATATVKELSSGKCGVTCEEVVAFKVVPPHVVLFYSAFLTDNTGGEQRNGG